jgi:hypothetical protein
MDYSEFNERRIKNLEMIQAVVTRLSNEGFLVKGWAITVASALFGFAISSESWALALVAIGPTLAFWLLDMTFLRSERLFRALHSHVQRGTGQVGPFFMAATTETFTKIAAVDPGGGVESHRAAFLRPALLLLYGAIMATAVVLAVVIWATNDSSATVVPVHLV